MEELKRMNLILPESLYRRIQKLANDNKSRGAKKGSVSRQIRRILEEYVSHTAQMDRV